MKTTKDNNKDMEESSKNPGDIDLDDDLMMRMTLLVKKMCMSWLWLAAGADLL